MSDTTITRDDLKSDPQRVLELARRPGGVEVTNADGTHAFRLSVPAEALPAIWHWIAWSKDRERICDCGIARATNEATARAIAWQCVGGPHVQAIREIQVKKVEEP